MQLHDGNVVIEFSSAGAGPVVVMLAGRGGEAPQQFEALGGALAAAGYRAVAINLRGVGASRGPLENLTLHDLAGDVAAVIDGLGGAAHIIGRAFGNRVARCTAVDYPDAVKSLCLIAAGGLIPPNPTAANRRRRSRKIPLRYSRVAGDAHEHAARTTPLDEWWSGGSAPMLVIQGQDDTIAVPENGRVLARDYPERVRLIEIADAGHAVLFEKPAQVIPEIVSFIDRLEHAADGA